MLSDDALFDDGLPEPDEGTDGVNAHVDLGETLRGADPVPAEVLGVWQDTFRRRDARSVTAELVEDSDEAHGPDASGAPRRLLFDAPDLSVVVDIVHAGQALTVTASVAPAVPTRALLRTARYEVELSMDGGTVGPDFVPRTPFSLAFELADGRRIHTEWVLP